MNFIRFNSDIHRCPASGVRAWFTPPSGIPSGVSQI